MILYWCLFFYSVDYDAFYDNLGIDYNAVMENNPAAGPSTAAGNVDIDESSSELVIFLIYNILI